eukprot:1119413-Prorocentrum_lima.AAC.1
MQDNTTLLNQQITHLTFLVGQVQVAQAPRQQEAAQEGQQKDLKHFFNMQAQAKEKERKEAEEGARGA